MNLITRYALIITALAVLAVLAFFGYKYYQFVQATETLPPEGSVIVFSYGGVGRQYVYANESLNLLIDSSNGEGVLVHEEIQSPLNIEDKLILGSDPEIPGMFLGLKKADGRITLLMTGGTNKAGLTASKSGVAVFAAQEGLTPLPVVQEPSTEGVESEAEETFVAENPFDEAPLPPAQAAYPELYAVEIDTGKITGLGAGRNPRFTEDGSVVALAANGIVRINPATGERVLLIERDQVALQGAVSPSGLVVAVPAPDQMSLELFNLSDSSGPKHIGYLMFEKEGPYPLAFTDDAHFFIRVGPNVAHLYNIPTEALPVATPVAIVGVNE